MSISLCRKAALTAALLLLGCAPVRTPESSGSALPNFHRRVEAVAKSAGNYKMLANQRVRIDARGEFLLDHEDEKNLYIVLFDPPAKYATTFPTPSTKTLATETVRNAAGDIKLIDIGQGLPHRGQWRDHFAVGDILGDGSTQIVFGPARKSGGGPVAFREQPDGWQRVDLKVPAGHYDYGGVAIGDFDGDGHNDLALAMHLTGFAILRARGDGSFERIDKGLPRRTDSALFGSGHAALALPAAQHEPAPLLLLQEAAFAPDPRLKRAPVLSMIRYTGKSFALTSIDSVQSTGDDIAYAPAVSKCKAKLAVAGGTAGAPLILERDSNDTWTARTVNSFPSVLAIVGAVALGDVDGDDCSDLAVAYSARIDGVWRSVVDVYTDQRSNWKRINLLDAAHSARVVAMTIAAHPNGALVLTIDEAGTLRGYRLGAGPPALVLDFPAPDWRRGCAGSDIHVLPSNGSKLRIAMSFAGEPTMGQFDNCRNGGGIEAWRME